MRLFLVLSCVVLCSCSSVSYNRNEASGEKVSFSASSLFSKKAVKDLEFSTGTNSTRSLSVKGFSDNSTEVAISAIMSALQAYTHQQSPTGTTPQPTFIFMPQSAGQQPVTPFIWTPGVVTTNAAIKVSP